MPTKKKRVGFIPREEVMRIIDKLSTENNLSNSKIISILVEEALSIRGIFNKKNVKVTKSNVEIKDDSLFINKDSPSFINNGTFPIDSKSGNDFNTGKSSLLNGANQDDFDMETYKMFLSFLKFQKMMDRYNA